MSDDYNPWTVSLGVGTLCSVPKTTFTDLKGILAANLRAERSAQGMSQEDLALLADVDRTYVSRVELTVANPSMLILHRLAESLDIELYELLITRKKSRPRA